MDREKALKLRPISEKAADPPKVPKPPKKPKRVPKRKPIRSVRRGVRMHSFVWQGKGEFGGPGGQPGVDTHLTVNIHHNGDHSGDAIVSVRDDNGVKTPNQYGLSTSPEIEIRIPVAALIEFVGEAYNSRLISKLEDLSGRETLNFLTGIDPKD
jgi:hypothetical protein